MPTAPTAAPAMASPVLSALSPVLLTQSPALDTALQQAATPPPVAVVAVCTEDTTGKRAIQDFPQDVGSALKLIMEELRTLRQEVLELRNELKKSNESCHTRMDGIENRLEALENRHADLPVSTGAVEGVIEQLKRDLNERDQELMANDLVIANLPESQAENPVHLVKLIASKLGVSMEDRDIVSAERVGGRQINATSPATSTEPRPRAIMVRLARRDLRDAFLDSVRVRRGATTEDLGFIGPARRFFISERLTKTNQQLFHKTRRAAGLHGWRFVWTKRGRILVRNKPGDPTHRIVSEEDIQKIIGPYTDKAE